MALNLAKPVKPQLSVLTVMPVLYLFILIAFSFWGFKTGFLKIKNQRTQLANAKRQENILAENEAILKAATIEIPQYVSPISIALPDKNPSLFLISQLKSLSSQNFTNLQDFRISSARGEGNSEVNVSFTITGFYPNIISFLMQTAKIAPLVVLQKMEMSLSQETASADIAMNSFWFSYPEKLSSITEPLTKLTSGNYEILRIITGLSAPVFTDLAPTVPYGRTNPFF